MQCGDVSTPATFDCIFQVIFPNLFNAAIVFVGIVILVMLVIGGMKFISSRGDNKQVEGAKKTITYAIIGAAVLLFSVVIINFIGVITGVTCIKFFSYGSCL
jgi:heme/copper-type cytochrome/quinol oxidase subunit 2